VVFVEEQAVRRLEKWSSSPGGPLERHVQDSGGQTSSGEHGEGPGGDHSLLDEEQQKERIALGTAAVTASTDSDEQDIVTAAEQVDVVDLECHEPVIGEASKRARSDGDDGDKRTSDMCDAETVQKDDSVLIKTHIAQEEVGAAEAAHAGGEDCSPPSTTLENPEAADDETAAPQEGDDSITIPTTVQVMLRQAMSTRQLQNKYEEVFGVPTKVHNKDWILSKISERVTLELPVASPAAQPSTKIQKRVQGGSVGAVGGGTGGFTGGGKMNDKHPGKEGTAAASGTSQKIGMFTAAASGDIPAGQTRCSRNDGKNWRCSEMAMVGHKHCPKHMRWSVGGRGMSGSKQQQHAHNHASTGVKRPRWLPIENPGVQGGAGGSGVHQDMLLLGLPFHPGQAGLPPHLMPPPPGAMNPLLAAPLLSAAASALDELHHKEESEAYRQHPHPRVLGMGGMLPPPMFGFGGWSGAAMGFIPGASTLRPTPTKASPSQPFSFDLLNMATACSGAQPPAPRSSAAASVAASVAAHASADPMSTGVDCTVELVPMPGAGSSTNHAGGAGVGAAGSTARTTLNLASLMSFDALHCFLASIVGAPPPAGGRHDPSALQVVYCDRSGVPTVLGGESWLFFMSRARSVHARLLVPREALTKMEPAAPPPHHQHVPLFPLGPFPPHIPSSSALLPHQFLLPGFLQMPPGAMFNPFAAMMAASSAEQAAPVPTAAEMHHHQLAGLQSSWAQMGLDPAMCMAMMMYAPFAAAAGSTGGGSGPAAVFLAAASAGMAQVHQHQHHAATTSAPPAGGGGYTVPQGPARQLLLRGIPAPAPATHPPVASSFPLHSAYQR